MNTKKFTIKELMGYARGQLIGKYGIAVFAASFPAIIEATITMMSGENVGSMSYYIGIIISIIADLLVGILIYGQAIVFLKLVRGKEQPGFSDIIYGFKNNMDKAILLQLPFTIASSLSCIPGIMIQVGMLKIRDEVYNYFVLGVFAVQFLLVILTKLWLGLNFYILADNPDYDVMTVYKASINQMSTNRGKYLLIYICCIPLMIVSFLACCVGVFWFEAFFNTTLADFYLLTKGEKPWSIEDELIAPHQ